jgi:hypothetical protein
VIQAAAASLFSSKPSVKAPKKPRDEKLYCHFIINPLPGGGVSIACRNCEGYNKAKMSRFNPSKGRWHLVNDCDGIGIDVKRQLSQGTQSQRRISELYTLEQGPTVTVADMRSNALSASSTAASSNASATAANVAIDLSHSPSRSTISSVSNTSAPSTASTWGSKRKHQPQRERAITDDKNFGAAMTQKEADKIIIAELKSILSRGESPARLLDPFVKAALLVRYPAIWPLLPRDVATIYNTYVVSIDHATTNQLKHFIQKIPGRCNIAMDGATVNGKQKVSSIALYF